MHNMEKCGRGKGRPQGCSLRSHRRRRLAPLPPPFSPAPMLRHVVYASLLHFGVETAVHLNRVIKKYDLDMIYVSGPDHGGPAVVANTYLEGTYNEIYPDISQDEAGLRKLFIRFSFPGGIPSHASPKCPNSIHEGDELGIRSAIRSGQYSTIPISLSPASSAMARRRWGRWPPHGTRTSSSIP